MIHILELMDKPAPFYIRRNEDSRFEATFTVEEINYLFSAVWMDSKYFGDQITEDFYNVEFTAEGSRVSNKPMNSFGISGTGHQFTVFATVAVLLDNLIRSNEPSAFAFTARESSRQRLYDTFAKKIQQKYKGEFRFETFIDSGDKYYIFYPIPE